MRSITVQRPSIPHIVPSVAPTYPAYGYQSNVMPSVSQMQLVPYNPAQVTQLYPQLPPSQIIQQQPLQQSLEKKPLTPEELQRLYSLNNAVVPRSNISSGYATSMSGLSNQSNYYTGPYSQPTYYSSSQASSYSSVYPAATVLGNIQNTHGINNTGAAPKVRKINLKNFMK